MIDYETAKTACETYVRSLENSDLETLLDLFADDASIEDPVGTDLREGKDVLRAFYSEACQGVAKAELTGNPRLAGNEVAFPFNVTAGVARPGDRDQHYRRLQVQRGRQGCDHARFLGSGQYGELVATQGLGGAGGGEVKRESG